MEVDYRHLGVVSVAKFDVVAVKEKNCGPARALSRRVCGPLNPARRVTCSCNRATRETRFACFVPHVRHTYVWQLFSNGYAFQNALCGTRTMCRVSAQRRDAMQPSPRGRHPERYLLKTSSHARSSWDCVGRTPRASLRYACGSDSGSAACDSCLRGLRATFRDCNAPVSCHGLRHGALRCIAMPAMHREERPIPVLCLLRSGTPLPVRRPVDHQETGGAYGRKRPSLVYHGHYCGARSGYNQVRRQYELRGHTRPLIALTMTAYGSNSRYQ
ncbi:hypothetical protein C8Q76DRAFT_339034 [Earliella scabrosa]|nr:hypothetical protein C8Q76DRAFT_339034 [Earliella scabrosa]